MPAEVVTLRFDVEDRGSRDLQRIEKNTSAVSKRMDQLSGRTGAAALAMQKINGPASGLAGILGGLGGKAKLAAASLALVTVGLNALTFRAATRDALEFSKAISEVSTLVDGGVAETSALATQVRLLSREYGQGQAAQARAFYNAISAGYTDTADAALVLESANKLALAGVTDVATSLDGLLATLKPYQQGAEGAAKASDQLFETVKRGITTVSELSNNLGQVTPVASQVGVKIEEVLGAIAAITATTKLSTSEATTQVSSLLRSLLQASERVPQFEKDFGFRPDFGIEELQQKGLVKFIADLNEQLERTGQKEAALFKLTGRAEALGAALTLAGPGAKAFADNVDAIGAASETTNQAVEKVRASSAQEFQELKAELVDLRIEIGQQLLPLLIETSRAILALFENGRESVRSAGEFVTYYTGQIQKLGAAVGATIYADNLVQTFGEVSDAIDRRFDQSVSANDSKRQEEARRAGKRLAENVAAGISDGSGDIAQATAAILTRALEVQNSASSGLQETIQKALDSRDLEATIKLRADVTGAFDGAESQVRGELDQLLRQVDSFDAFEARKAALVSLEENLATLTERRAEAESELGRQVDALTRKREAEIAQLRIAAEGKRGEAALSLAGAPESSVAALQGDVEKAIGLELLNQLSAERDLAKTEAERQALQEKFSATFSEISLKRTENLRQVEELRQQEGELHRILIERIGLENDFASFRRTAGLEEISSREQVLQLVGREFELRGDLVQNSIADLEAQLAITDNLLKREEIEARIAGLRQEQTDLGALQAAEEERRIAQLQDSGEAVGAAKQIEQAWGQIGDAISGAASDALLSYIQGTQSAEDAFRQFAVSVLQQIQQIIVQTLVAAAVQAALGGGAGGAGGLIAGALFHDGGPVRKYHSGGLAADEVPAILQTGEYVVSRQGVSAAGLPALHSINRGEAPSLAPEGVARVVAMGAPSRPAPLAPAQSDGGGAGSGFAGGGSGGGERQVERVVVLNEADLAEKMANSTSLRAAITQIVNETRD